MQKTEISLSDIDNLDKNNSESIKQLIDIFGKANGFEFSHLKGETNKNLCIHYNPEIISINNIRAILATQGYILNHKFKTMSLTINNLDCIDCVKVVEHIVKKIPGTISIVGSYTTGTFRIDYDSSNLDIELLKKQLTTLNYNYNITDTTANLSSIIDKKTSTHPHSHHHKHNDHHEHHHANGEIHLGCKGSHKHSSSFFGKYKEFILSMVTGILWLIGYIAGKFEYSVLSTAFLIVAYITGGFEAFIDSLRAFSQKRLTIESLMVFAAIGAGLLGKLNEGILLLLLFGIGHALEHFSLEKAKKSIKALTDMSPKTAILKNPDGTEQQVLVNDLKLNQTIIIKPGQLISSDGVIISGNTTINEAAITGESVPVTKELGNEVFAGTINGDGLINVKITKLATETMLAKMIRLVTEADTQKSKTQKFAEKFEKYFVPTVLIGIILIAIIPPLFNLMTIKQSIYMAIIVLVSASPCALALATPVAVLIGISKATQIGVLIKGGAALENLGMVNVIAFDKTGTLTIGKPAITNIHVLADNSKDQALALAYGIELGSAHPFAQAIIEYAKTYNITPSNITGIQNISGKGVTGIYNNQEVKLGSHKLFNPITDDNVSLYMRELEQSGATPMILSLDNKPIAIFGLKDTIRNGMANTLSQLKSLGVQKNIMLTGDNKVIANAIGHELGIDEINSELMPEDKLTLIKQLTNQYSHVAMVGDGINDAPAMANATIGIAMGGTKTDVAIETSNVVLMNDRINQLPNAIKISKNVRKIIKQNLFISLGVVAALVIAGLMSYTNIVIAVAIHEGSTLAVIFNALRLMYSLSSKTA